MWNMMSLYNSGSLKALTKELMRYCQDFLQEIGWGAQDRDK
jgi:hypothetical protein